MSSSEKTTRKDPAAGGVTGTMKKAFKAGLGVAENMHQFAVEIPLNMVPESVATREQTDALKSKHKSLLRRMYGSIDSLATSAMDVGEEQAGRFAAGLKELAEQIPDDDEPAGKHAKSDDRES